MDKKLMPHVLSVAIRHFGKAEIQVVGFSMNPTFYEGDLITVVKSDTYEVGDVIVFAYGSAGLIVHRLIEKSEEYICRGDNAFRGETISPDEIVGKVVSVNGEALEDWPKWKIEFSKGVGRVFAECGEIIGDTRKTGFYRAYSFLVLHKKEDLSMKYQKNDSMDYIQTDETSLAVFDPESGDTHFFDETGADILNCLAEPCSFAELLAKLGEIYAAKPEDISSDVEEFLGEVVARGIVRVI